MTTETNPGHAERDRHDLYDQLAALLGAGPASTLMSLLPPVGWPDLATRQDVALLRAELREEMSELRGEFGELRGEFGELRGEFGVLRGDVADAMRRQTYGLVAAMFTISGLTGLAAAAL